MIKKNLLILFFITFSSTFVKAQFTEEAPWMKSLKTNERKALNKPITFKETVEAFNTYWEIHDQTVRGSGYKPFKRWESHWENYVKEDGTLPTTAELWETYLEVKNKIAQKTALVDESNWQPVGPFSHIGHGNITTGGQGRINVAVKDIVNSGVYYAGAPAGGIWKTTDNGATWSTTTDFLPQIGVSGIAIDYGNPGTIYIATGDDDGSDSSSIGVWKSSDAGVTWVATGLSITAGNTPSKMNDIYVHPNNSNTIWVATNNGVFKSTDSGVNWTNQNGTQGVNIRDLKVKPQDPTTLYAASSNTLYKSTDSGDTFIANSMGLPTGASRLVMGVTNANPNMVYVFVATSSNGFGGVYRSIDSGGTFNSVYAPSGSDIFESPQSWFDMAFAVSDSNENEFYTGVLNIWKGIVDNTGQATMTKMSNAFVSNEAYTHADIHYLGVSNGELLVGSDGGFYTSTDQGLSFTDKTANMQISQFYRVATSKYSSNRLAGGLQDNGGFGLYGDQWRHYHGGDGMDAAIDPGNPNIYYGFQQNGTTLNYVDFAGTDRYGLGTFPSTTGNWVTPLVVSSDSKVYAGYTKIYTRASPNQFYLSPISPDFGDTIDVLEVDEANPDIMFVGVNRTISKTIDRAVSFTTVDHTAFTPNIPSNQVITSIEINHSDSNIVYVTTSGNGFVYKSTDGGLTFNSISNGLPAVAKNSIKHQDLHSKNPLYLGTSIGVYRYDDDTLTWELFNTNLPNSPVRDIEINIVDNKITAATYGRGMWQSELPIELAPTDIRFVEVQGLNTTEIIECNATVNPEIIVKNNGLSTITEIQVDYTIDGTNLNYIWTGNLVSEATTTINLPQLPLTRGAHQFSATINTVNDAHAINNELGISFIYVNNTQGTPEVINTFETDGDKLTSYSEGDKLEQVWERGIPTGTNLNDNTNPTNKMYGTNLSGVPPFRVKTYLLSECYDLTTITDPLVQFDLAYDLQFERDVLYMEYSIDQGVNWIVLGTSTDLNWYNNGNSSCTDCVGAQWTGQDTTLTSYNHSLALLASETSVMLRFVYDSYFPNSEEGAIIDNFVVGSQSTLNSEEFELSGFLVFPNPSKGIFNIKTKNNENFNLSVYDITGKQVLEQIKITPNNNAYPLDISNYVPGIYFLNLSTNKGKITKKLILN